MKTARELAQEIADELFTNGENQKANLLVLDMNPILVSAGHSMQNHRIRSGGGWCYEAVVNAIEANLAENLFWKLS